MENRDTALVLCQALAPEVERILPPDIEVRVLEFGLHNTPGKLKERLRLTLDELEQERRWKQILFGYGLCSEGAIGLKPVKTKLVLPRTDDCIGVFLGSKQAYLEQIKKQPGTFFLTKGWIEHGENPLSVFWQQPEWTKKYSPAKAQWLARETIKNYKCIALIDTGAYELAKYEAYARKTAETFGLDFEIIPGSLAYLKSLIHGPWNHSFVTVEPGQEITREMFYQQAGSQQPVA